MNSRKNGKGELLEALLPEDKPAAKPGGSESDVLNNLIGPRFIMPRFVRPEKEGVGVKATVVLNVPGKGEIHHNRFTLGNAYERDKYINGCLKALNIPKGSDDERDIRKWLDDRILKEIKDFEIEETQKALGGATSASQLSKEDRDSAEAILKKKGLLYDVGKALEDLGLVGEAKNARILYLAMTSRLLETILSAAIKGESSMGKSSLTEKVRKFFPEEAYVFMTGLSAHSLFYSQDDYRHRMLIVAEAKGMENAEYTIRTLLSENRLVYQTVNKDPETGSNKGMKLQKEGPTGLILTTTLAELHPENETRLITLSMDESEEQTRRIMERIAQNCMSGGPQIDLKSWVNAQRLLQPVQVIIPYADYLSKRLPANQPRMRRDFDKLLLFIKTSAVLHQFQRKHFGSGVIKADLEDYFITKELFEGVFFDTLYEIHPNTRTVMEAIKLIYGKKNTGSKSEKLVTTRELVDHLGWSKKTVLKWAQPLEDYRWIESSGFAYAYRPGTDPEANQSKLPTVEDLAEHFPELAEGFEAVHPITGESKMLRNENASQKEESPGYVPQCVF